VGHAFAAPMLCRSAPLPRGRGWAHEPKWDGFRALVSVNGDVRVRGRRGWDMTALVPERLCQVSATDSCSVARSRSEPEARTSVASTASARSRAHRPATTKENRQQCVVTTTIGTARR
jgi:ATP-dependent DNA ligase